MTETQKIFMKCPFCERQYGSKIMLKAHLKHNCYEYDAVQSLGEIVRAVRESRLRVKDEGKR